MSIPKITSVTVHSVHCPHCDYAMFKSTDFHAALSEKPKAYEEARCKSCLRLWTLSLVGGQLNIAPWTQVTGRAFAPALVLMRTHTTPAIYFVVETASFDPDDVEENRYYYNEHTCPTNWLKETICTIVNGKTILLPLQNVIRGVANGIDDNHDMYSIVAIRNAEELYKKLGVEYNFLSSEHGVDFCHFSNENLWPDIFPEAFDLGGPVIDGELAGSGEKPTRVLTEVSAQPRLTKDDFL